MDVHYRLMRTVPQYAEARAASENHALRAAMTGMIGRTGCTRIPVVVHVVHNTAAQNISDAQINSQIDVLNHDYRRMNADIGTVPAAFAGLTADTRIEFQLATTDPGGNPTNGITRTATASVSFTDDDRVKSAATGGHDAWPADRYLNIWVCPLGGGLLGYAQFPGGPAATDGVVILHSAFGTSGTAAAPFNLGRTATHEIGHWLNLRHIWGDDGTGCAGSDFVADTPNQGGPNYGVPTFPRISCGNGPSGDMFMNYMDYVDDAAMVMFSAGQVTRMQAALDGLRSSIGSTIPCDGGGIKKLEPDIKKREPDIKKIEPDIKKREPDIKKIEPDVKKREPDIKKREPDIKKIEPDIKKREPDIKKFEPDIKKREPDIKKFEPDVGPIKREPEIPPIGPGPVEGGAVAHFEGEAQGYQQQAYQGYEQQAYPGYEQQASPGYEQGYGGYEGGGAGQFEERLQRIEAALAQLSHFIQQSQRPDVGKAPLRKERKPK
jgi:hypothetical protein